LRSASKLKRGVIKRTGGLFWFSVIVDFSSPIFFWIFYVPWIVLRTLFVNRFQSILFYILHDICLVYVFVNLFFNVVFCVCSLFFFLSQPDLVNITWITGNTHCSIVDKIDPTSEDVEMIKKKSLSITLGYIFLWNVIRRIYLPFLQLISKNTVDEPWRGSPLFLSSKVEEWLIMTFVMEACLLDPFVVFGFRFGTNLNW
jgi:hypothetical protein